MTAVEKLQKKMVNKVDCALITSDINRRYFTGMKSSAGTLVVFPKSAYLIIDFRYIEKARAVVKDAEVILQDKLYEQINELCRKHHAVSVSVEAETLSIAEGEHLVEKLVPVVDKSQMLSRMIGEIRIIKTREEIDKMISAQRIAEQGFEHMLDFIKVGRTEKEIQLELDFFMLSHGAEALSFDTIALSGVNTSMPHGVPSDKKVEQGEFVLLDFGAVVDGYHSDMTRTVCVGEPTAKMEDVYNIVLKAQTEALSAARSGMTGKALDKIARDVIKAAGYGENFGHSLGHGVGVEIHEAPNASPSYDKILEEDMIVTVEPGIYIEGEFGVRIEDFVILHKTGCENMTNAPKNLIVL